VIFRNT